MRLKALVASCRSPPSPEEPEVRPEEGQGVQAVVGPEAVVLAGPLGVAGEGHHLVAAGLELPGDGLEDRLVPGVPEPVVPRYADHHALSLLTRITPTSPRERPRRAPFSTRKKEMGRGVW